MSNAGVLDRLFPGFQPKTIDRGAADPQAATPVREQKAIQEDNEASSKSLPEQVDFSELLGVSAEPEEEGKIPDLPSFSKTLTDEALQQLAGSVNFSNYVPKDVEEQYPGIGKAIEGAAKAAYLTALKHSGALSDEAMRQLDSRAQATSKKQISQYQSDAPYEETDSGLKPFIDTLRRKYPTAPPDWVISQAKRGVAEMGTKFAQELGIQTEVSRREQAEPDKVDWLRFAGVSSN